MRRLVFVLVFVLAFVFPGVAKAISSVPFLCDSPNAPLWLYGVKLHGDWTVRNRKIVQRAVYDIGKRLMNNNSISPCAAFRRVFPHINITWGDNDALGGCEDVLKGACVSKVDQINFYSLAQPGGNKTHAMAYVEARNLVIHELGHSFAWLWGRHPDYPADGPYKQVLEDLLNNDGFYPSPPGAVYTWRQHPCQNNQYSCVREVFADMFLGWVYDKWADDEIGEMRATFMNENMPVWINEIMTDEWEYIFE